MNEIILLLMMLLIIYLNLQVGLLMTTYIPLRKITDKEFKRRYKPWISKGILISINGKNKLYNKDIKCKNNELKNPNIQ